VSLGDRQRILGLAAFGIATQNTGTEGLAVMFVVAIQWMVALVGGFILGGTAAGHGRRVGLLMNVSSVVLTLIALIYYYKVVRL